AMLDQVLVDLLLEAEQALGPADSTLRARVLARRALEVRSGGTGADSTGPCEEALAVARRVGGPEALATPLPARYTALWLPGAGSPTSPMKSATGSLPGEPIPGCALTTWSALVTSKRRTRSWRSPSGWRRSCASPFPSGG